MCVLKFTYFIYKFSTIWIDILWIHIFSKTDLRLSISKVYIHQMWLNVTPKTGEMPV